MEYGDGERSQGNQDKYFEEESSSGLGSEEEGYDLHHVWCKGEQCKVQYSEDGDWYDAKIRLIFKNDRGRMTALVSYLGFSSDNDEEVEVSHLRLPSLKPRKKKSSCIIVGEQSEADTSIFQPLRGDENKSWLENKFQILEEEEKQDASRSRKTWGTTTKTLSDKSSRSTGRVGKRKMVVASGGQAKKECSAPVPPRSDRSSSNGTLPRAGCSTAYQEDSTDSENDHVAKQDIKQDRISTTAGFSETDMEKPNFGHSACSPKEVLVLSEQDESPIVQIPATINQYLREYQRDGIRFLYSHYRRGGGGILGDDMGLGKTVQVIGFMAAVLSKTGTKTDVLRQKPRFIRMMSDKTSSFEEKEGEKKTFLIIGPASVLYNWIDELETWGHFTVGKYHKNHKVQTMSDLKKEKLDVVVTTFETCRDNIDELNTYPWAAVIADEAHKIKGLKAETTQALKKLTCKKRFGLTGTALQNQLKELWCILDWANPGCLGSVKQFHANYEKMIEKGQRHDATKRELAHARKAKEKFANLKNRWMIRRTKAIIADQLPKKEERVVYCRPTEFQLSVYKAILNHKDMKLIFTQGHPCDCHSGLNKGRCCYRETSDGQTIKQLTFTFLHLLLKTANHVALLMPSSTQSNNQREWAEEICKVAFASHPQFVEQTREASFRTLSDPKYCGKMKVLQGLLSVFKKEKNKVLIFSQSTRLLDILEQYVVSMGYEFRRLDGKTPDVKRVQLVRQFNKDPNIFLFLVSTRAGGVGLNMTGANVVMIFDPNWNPTHDLQAQDRAYRIGQGRDVRIFRLVCSGTIEENIYLRQVYKQQLDRVAVGEENAKRYFHGVQGNKKLQGELFGIENLFQLRTGDRCMTADILQRNDKIEAGLRGFQIERYIPSTYELAREKELKEDDEEQEDSDPSTGSNEEEEDPYRDGYSDSSDSECDRKRAIDVNKSKKKKSKDTYDLDYFCSQVLGLEDLENASDQDSATGGDKTVSVSKRKISGSKTCQRNSDSDSDIPNGQRPTPGFKKARFPRPTNSRHSSKNLDVSPHSKSGLNENRKPVSTKRSRIGENIDECSSSEEDNKRKGKGKGVGKRSKVTFKEASAEERHDGVDQSLARATFESVSDVFRECGVVHMHENQKITGASRAEDHMSRCAVQDVFELHQHSQAPAIWCEQLEESSSTSESDDLGEAHRKPNKKGQVVKQSTPSQIKEKSRNSAPCQSQLPRAQVIGNKKVLIGQTPKGIRKLQFGHMAVALGKPGPINLARHVLFSSADDQQDMLQQFYLSQDPDLKPAFENPHQPVKATTPKSKAVIQGRKRTKPEVKPKKKPSTKTTKTKKGLEYTSESEENGSEGDLTPQPPRVQKSKPVKSTQGRGTSAPKQFPQKEEKTAALKFDEMFNEAFGIGQSTQEALGMAANNEGLINEKSQRSRGKTGYKEQDSLDDILEDFGISSQDSGISRAQRYSAHVRKEAESEMKANILDDILSDNSFHYKRRQPPKKRTPPARSSVHRKHKSVHSTDDVFDFLHSGMPDSGQQRGTKKKSSDHERHTECDEGFDIFDLDMKIKSSQIPHKTEFSKSHQRYQGDLSTQRGPLSESESDDSLLDMSKWTKMKSKRHNQMNISSQESIDIMISEDDKLYDNLFKTGKLGKKL